VRLWFAFTLRWTRKTPEAPPSQVLLAEWESWNIGGVPSRAFVFCATLVQFLV
jgi:hypothetical protein